MEQSYELKIKEEETREAAEKMVRVVETPIFIPYTKDSTLRKRLQESDDKLGEDTNSPGVKFVERCGGLTLMDILTRSNP